MSKELFDSNLCNDLREVINRTNIFFKDTEQSKKFDFICAIMDRFDFTINYLNEHFEKPKSDIDYMTYLMQASILKDGINYCYKVLNMSPVVSNDIFKEYAKRDLNCEEISDDEFFEYFRSLTFAHPFKTDRSIPNALTNEIQYSPYCLLDSSTFKNDENPIGVYVYSNKRKAFSITLPFEVLQEYLLFKYNLITNVIVAFNTIIIGMENEWRKRKVNRKQDNVEILKEIVDILNERYMEHYPIDILIDCLTCNLTLKENEKNVEIFRNEIRSLIPELCDAIDEFKCDDIYNISYRLTDLRPKAHPMMHYQLEKIFCYLSDNSYGDVEWGLAQAEAFSKEFAKKWVLIKPYDMSYKEIRLLTYVACYLEYMDQNPKEV